MPEEKKKEAQHIQSVNDDVFANLTIEEIEDRLEMQILSVSDDDLLGDCCRQGCNQHSPGGGSGRELEDMVADTPIE